MYTEITNQFYKRLAIRSIKDLIKPARGGDNQARSRLLNLVPPHQQAKLLDEWGIGMNNISYTELGEIYVH